MKQMTLSALVLSFVLITLTGCQESNSSQIQRARLVGNENLKLNNQLEEKNLEITKLKKDIENLHAEMTETAMETGNTNIRIMQIVAETEQRNQALIQENEKLKEELEKLTAQ